MISVTNDAKTFFEKEQGEIVIYGAGNAGYWIGHYMDKCNIPYSFYLDRQASDKSVMYNDHPIYPVDKLKELSGVHLRLIVSPTVYKEILADLLWLDHLWHLDLLCIIPQYSDLVEKDDRYNINRFLGYFRRRLIVGEYPTIISNTCIAGRLYEAFNMPLLSPFINTGIDIPDYIKMCRNLKRYIDEDLKILYWEKGTKLCGADGKHVTAQLGDIRIVFAHVDSIEGIVEKWDLLKQRINWSRIIYVLEEQPYRKAFSIGDVEKFMQIPGKKLYVKGTSFYECISQKPLFMRYEDVPNRREPAMENYFDLVEWLNKD
jgi:uncharacterized protein (DUF1919 family)